jgi:hypothetical protein
MTPEPNSGPVPSVPEPGSLVLLSLGLGAVILGRKFRIGSLNPASDTKTRRTSPQLKEGLRLRAGVLRQYVSAGIRH